MKNSPNKGALSSGYQWLLGKMFRTFAKWLFHNPPDCCAGRANRQGIDFVSSCLLEHFSERRQAVAPFFTSYRGFGVELLLPENDYNSHQHEKAGGYLRDVFFVACQFRLELFVYLDTYDCYRHEPY